MDRRLFTNWIASLVERLGAAEGAIDMPLPRAIEVESCVDRAQEVTAIGARLHAWRLAGIPAARTAVISSRAETARDLAAATGEADPALLVGELGLTDTSGTEALALVGCDHSFFVGQTGSFAAEESLNPREQVRLVLRACSAPSSHLLITWRGRPDRLFDALADG